MRSSLILLIVFFLCCPALFPEAPMPVRPVARVGGGVLKLEVKLIEVPFDILEDIKSSSSSSRLKNRSGLSEYLMNKLLARANDPESNVKVKASAEVFLNDYRPVFFRTGKSYSYIREYVPEISGKLPLMNEIFKGTAGCFQLRWLMGEKRAALVSWAVMNAGNTVRKEVSGKPAEGMLFRDDLTGIDLPAVRGFCAASDFIAADGEIRLLFSTVCRNDSAETPVMHALFVRSSFPEVLTGIPSGSRERLEEKQGDLHAERALSLTSSPDSLPLRSRPFSEGSDPGRSVLSSGKIFSVRNDLLLRLLKYRNDSDMTFNLQGQRLLSASLRNREAVLIDAFDLTGLNASSARFISGSQESYIASLKPFNKKFDRVCRVGNVPWVKEIFSGTEFRSSYVQKSGGIMLSGRMTRRSDVEFQAVDVDSESIVNNQDGNQQITDRVIEKIRLSKPVFRESVKHIDNLVPKEKTVLLIGDSVQSKAPVDGLLTEIMVIDVSEK